MVVSGLDMLFLLLVGGLKLSNYELSEFALREQLAHKTDRASKLKKQLNVQLPQVRLLQKTKLAIAYTVLVGLLITLSSVWLGVLLSLAAVLLIVLLQRLSFIQSLAQSLFEKTLDIVLKTAQILEPLWKVIGLPPKRSVVLPSSRSEFLDQLRRFPSTVLEPTERHRVELLLLAHDKTVQDIMTPRKRVMSVNPTATLGPIVLSELQKSGHGYFPVTAKKSEPEGLLILSQISDVHSAKKKLTVQEAMSTQLVWVDQDMSLLSLAQIFLSQKQHLLLVRNEDGFIGLVTISDLMKHLTGIVKED